MARYLCILAGIFVIVSTGSATYAASASATCAKVIPGEVSSWNKKTFLLGCRERVNSTGKFTKIQGVGTEVGSGTGIVCYKVGSVGEESMWSDTGCTTLKIGKGEYIKVEQATVESLACGSTEEEGAAVRRGAPLKDSSVKELAFAYVPPLAEMSFA
jgi:hypothetical protein